MAASKPAVVQKQQLKSYLLNSFNFHSHFTAFSLFTILLIAHCLPLIQVSSAYELRAVSFEGKCQVWYYSTTNDGNFFNGKRVPVYFFYDPAPLLVARNWRTQRKFVFIHPENKQLHQISQDSINQARKICNIGDTAMEMQLANQTMFSTMNGYSSNWRSSYRYNYRSTYGQDDTFDVNQFRDVANLARFLRPNGTEQFYQVWRDKTGNGRCKASLVFDGTNSFQNNNNQLSFRAHQLKQMRTYPLYNCLVAASACRSYHVFLVNEDDMEVYEVNVVEETNYENRWDLIPGEKLGTFWTNGSFFPERRRNTNFDEYADHCSYAQDFQPVTPQNLGKNLDYVRPPSNGNGGRNNNKKKTKNGAADFTSEDESDQTVENSGDDDLSASEDDGNDVVGANGNGGVNGRRKGGVGGTGTGGKPVPKPRTNGANGRGGNGGRGSIDVANDNNKNNNNNRRNGSGRRRDDPSNSSNEELEGEEDDNSTSSEEDDVNGDGSAGGRGIEVSSGNKINISGGGLKGGRRGFTMDESNKISIGGGQWNNKGKSRPPKIELNRQTSIKMKKRK